MRNIELMDKDRIKQRLAELGRTQAELARHLGLDASAVSRLFKGERQLKGQEAAAMAAFLGIAVDEVLGAAQVPRGGGEPMAAADAFMAWPMDIAQGAERKRNLPVFGAAIGGVDGAFEMNGVVHEYTERPPQLDGVRNAYAIYVTGDSMHPMFQPGWVLHVNPNRPLTSGCGVVLQIRSAEAPGHPLCYIKEFVRRTSSKLVVRQYNPAGDIEWPLERVVAVHRVVGVAEM
ncbi:MAG: helix-turn-helix domain-containing protein [Rhodospirillales bacterium]|nr:helix-turn-helix domain-containing protein [Rhodospirillales bacterium]